MTSAACSASSRVRDVGSRHVPVGPGPRRKTWEKRCFAGRYPPPRLLDLTTLESRIVAPQLAGVINGYPRDDGGFVLYGVTSWPYIDPVHRPLVLVDPASKDDRVLVDQGPDDWAYPFMDWASNDWVLLIPEFAREGDRPGVNVAVDTRSGARYEFKLDQAGRTVAP